ncbi:MAG: S8 family serine peptidase [Oscillospiraceae bacterium]|nr:S8 family serine peptidase [Oscillospiraceae bacterium]
MKVKRINKIVSILLVTLLLLSSGVLAAHYDEGFILSDYESELQMIENSNSQDCDNCEYCHRENLEFMHIPLSVGGVDLTAMLNVQYTSDTEHFGYNFQLIDGAVAPDIEGWRIRVISARLNMFWALSLEDIIEFIDPELIVWIEPDYIIYLEPMPEDTFMGIVDNLPSFAPHAFAPVNDPRYSDQWNLELIRGAAAWSSNPQVDMSEVVVAVIDSGIHRAHEDFVGANILPGRNFVVSFCGGIGECILCAGCAVCRLCDHCGDCNACRGCRNCFTCQQTDCYMCVVCDKNIVRHRTDIDDESGHGTNVTGIIAARRGNGVGIASMACGVSILPLRVYIGTHNSSRGSLVAEAIEYAAGTCPDRGRRRADIINLSLGGPTRSETMVSAVRNAADQGILMIAGAGNNGNTTPIYPASFLDVIGVGSVTIHGTRASTSQQNNSVHVTAPGAGVPTLGHANASDPYPASSGTSMAAPHITALAAIARGYNPRVTQDEFSNMLRDSAIPRGTSRPNNTHSYHIKDTEQLLRARITPSARTRNNSYGYGIIDVGLFMYNLRGRDFFNFTDIQTFGWAQSYINESARYGIMHGRGVAVYEPGDNHGADSHSSFSPNTPMWRLEFPMALGRLHELNGGNILWLQGHSAEFTDLDHTSLFPYNYSRYAVWANEQGIVFGTDYHLFSPGGNVSRGQAATMLYRYAQILAISCTTAQRLNDEIFMEINRFADGRAFLAAQGFLDTCTIYLPYWAVDSTAWAVSAGFITGRAVAEGVRLDARDTINRAEGAAMLARYRRIFLRDTFILGQRENQGGGQGGNTFSRISLNIGGTISNPTTPVTVDTVSMIVGDNVLNVLSWVHDGALAHGPTRVGYQFSGWYMDEIFATPVTHETTVPETPMMLYARWERVNFSFDIFNNGSEGCPSTPNTSLAAGGTIRMWTRLGGVNTRIPFAFVSTIEATVRNTGACAEEFLVINRMWEAGTGWVEYFNRIDVNKTSACAWEFIDLSITVFGQTVDVVLHNAHYIPISSVTLTFNAGGGAGDMVSVNVPVGETFMLPANGFTAPTGYVFYEWFVTGYAAPGGAMNPGDVITVSIWPNATVTITAIWVPVGATTHTVTFAAGSGTGTMTSVNVSIGDAFTLPANGFAASTGYVFHEWFVTGYAAPGGAMNPGDVITLIGPVTVTAIWVAESTEPFSVVLHSVVGVDGRYTGIVTITGITDFTGHTLRIVRTPGGVYGGITEGVQAAATQTFHFCELVRGITVSVWCPTGILLGFDIWIR